MSASLFSVDENAICNTNVHPSTLPFPPSLPPVFSPSPFSISLRPPPSLSKSLFATAGGRGTQKSEFQEEAAENNFDENAASTTRKTAGYN